MQYESNNRTARNEEAGIPLLFSQMRAMLDTLEKRFTGSDTKKSRTPRKAPPIQLPDIKMRMKEELSKKSMSVQELAKALAEDPEKIQKAINECLKTGQVINTMGGDRPKWRWALYAKNPGNIARREVIKQLLMERPMSHSEIRDALKADDQQIQNDLIELRRTEPMWRMNPTGHDLIYWLPPDRIPPPPSQDARLKQSDPRRRSKK